MKNLYIFLSFILPLYVFSVGEVFVFNDYKNPDRIINFPDTDKYQVVIADLHTHSVFSDGAVLSLIHI